MSCDRKHWQKCAPGIYRDEHDALHLDLHEILQFAGYPATADNLAMVERAAREQLATLYPRVPLMVVDDTPQ